VAVEYADQDGSLLVPRYENQPLRETVESQVRAAGALPAAPAQADAVLFVHTPIGVQIESADAPPVGESPRLAAQAEDLVAETRQASAAGRLVGLADVAYANGADPELIAALARRGGAAHLTAYAGWNTASNTIGTVITQLCLAAAPAIGQAEQPQSSRPFLACRLLDDYGYQSRVRKQALRRAAETKANPYALGEQWPDFEASVRGELQPLAHRLYSDLLGAEGGGLAEAVRVSLPWRRLFEVEVDILSPGSKNR